MLVGRYELILREMGCLAAVKPPRLTYEHVEISQYPSADWTTPLSIEVPALAVPYRRAQPRQPKRRDGRFAVLSETPAYVPQADDHEPSGFLAGPRAILHAETDVISAGPKMCQFCEGTQAFDNIRESSFRQHEPVDWKNLSTDPKHLNRVVWTLSFEDPSKRISFMKGQGTYEHVRIEIVFALPGKEGGEAAGSGAQYEAGKRRRKERTPQVLSWS